MTKVVVRSQASAPGACKPRIAAQEFWGSIALLALLFCLLAPAAAAQGAGELDPSFDGDGRVVTDFGGLDPALGVVSVAVQSDGKIVAAGDSSAGDERSRGWSNFALARYNPDGSLDTSFGGDGKVVTDFGANDAVRGIAIQADGTIVAAGFSEGANFADFALARYNPDGSLDTSFDGDGKVVTDFGGSEQAQGVAMQTDGRIIAAGQSFIRGDSTSSNFALARYNSDGSLDTSFDGDGRVVTDLGAADVASGIAIQADGKIVAAGTSLAFTNPPVPHIDFALARYNQNGSLDTSFDGDGKVVTDFGERELAQAVAIQADGKIVAAGQSLANQDFALARYNPDGSLDTSFDGDGKVLTDFDGRSEWASGVAIQLDGRIVVAGGSGTEDFEGVFDGDFALARYDPDGGLDPSFDGDGRVLTDFGRSSEGASGLAIQSDGRIVVAGIAYTSPFAIDFALARYLADAVNARPDCTTVAASPRRLWPPNHRLELVGLSDATDPDGDPVALTITGVTQDEPLDGPSDGATSPDARAGSRSSEILMRAERSSRGDGRVYRVSFTGSDGKGGSCTGTATVRVPRNPRSTATDSAPPSFNSLGP